MTEDWRDRLVVPDGVGCRLHSGYLQSPDPGLEVVDFHKHRLLDTSSFPLRVGLEFCVTLEGPGFLVVRDPKTGTRYLTRCGLMHADWEGWLVTVPDGYRVQGWTNRVLSLSGDVRVDATDRPAEAEDAFLMHTSVLADGSLAAFLSNGVQYTRAKLWIARIPHPTLLREVRHGLYATPEGGELESTSEPTFDFTTELKMGNLDPRFLSAERQRWLHRRYQFQQNVVSRTGIDSHLAIGGDGFFRLRDPKSGQQLLTRSGLFQWSDDGYLEGLHGWRVQGWSPTALSKDDLIDVRTHHGGRPMASDQYQIWHSGEVVYSLPDGTQQILTQILLVHVPDPMILQELEPRHYLFPVEEVDRSLSFHGVPGTQGLGKVMSGALEAIWYEEFWQVQDIPDEGRLLQLRGLAGRRAKIQISEDMNTWSNWMSVDEDGQIQGGRMDFADPTRRTVCWTDMVLDAEKPQGTARFYRLVVETNSWPWLWW
jgi:flagellar hook protein FlgE